MVGVDDGGGVFELALFVQFQQAHKVFVMIVGDAGAVFIDAAPQDAVRQGVAGGGNVVPAVQKAMAGLRRLHRIEHDGEVAAGRVLHAHGDIHAARRQAVLLVFYRARPYRLVREDVV